MDEAANAANNRRSEAFWHDRRALETALVWHRGLHRAILRNLLQQARQTVVEQKPDTPTVEETAPNLVEQVPWYRNSGQCQCAWSLARGP